MYNSIWNRFNRSVCSLDFYNNKGIRFYRLSGFRFEDFIISGACRDEIRRAGYITVNFPACLNGNSPFSTRFSGSEFTRRLNRGNKSGLPGLIFIGLKSGELHQVPPVEYSGKSVPETGSRIAMIACSPQTSQLCMKTGFLSAIIDIRGRSFMLVDSSFEQCSYGAPLFDLKTGSFSGVMTDCFSSGAEKYRKLKHIISHNLRLLNNATGKWNIGNIDPAQVLAANQYMIKHLAKEIFLSSRRGTGLAVPAGDISRFGKSIRLKGQFLFREGAQIKPNGLS